MNVLLLKSSSGNDELLDLLNLLLDKYNLIEVKELDAYNVYVSFSEYDESYNKEGGDAEE
jgi:hypothetical protein